MLRTFIFGFGTLYIVALLGMYVFQRNLQYLPNRATITPAEVGLTAQSVALKTKDGETLVAWHHLAKPGFPTILYFHGNGGGIATPPNKQAFFSKLGFGFFALSYRGYQGSTGTPSEDGLMIDSETAYAYLVNSGVKPKQIFLFGESLGTGVAVQLAAKFKVSTVALEAPYANAVDVAASRYWFFPVHWLMKDQFKSADFITRVNVPLFITHGVGDWTIPISQGRKLFALANEPKQMVEIDGVGHDIISDAQSWGRIAEFYSDVMGKL